MQFKKIYNRINEFQRLKRTPSLKSMTRTFFKYNLIQPFFKKPFLPTSMCMYVTYRCNFRCKICGIWRLSNENTIKDEIPLSGLEEILKDPLFRKINYVNINGGEPNLREDLIEIVELIIRVLGDLRVLTINSNGFPAEICASNFDAISKICSKKDIRFSASISMHGLGDVYEKISGTKNSFNEFLKTIKKLKELSIKNKFYLSINCVINKFNAENLNELLNWSKDINIPINFTLGEVRERFNNLDMDQNILLGNQDQKRVIDFLKHVESNSNFLNHHSFRYRAIVGMISSGHKREISCYYRMGGLILGSEGNIYYCKKSKAIGNCRNTSAYKIYYGRGNLLYRDKEIIKNLCPGCIPNSFIKPEIEKDILKYLIYYLFKRMI